MTVEMVVVARRWTKGWELHVGDRGVTQVKNLARAERQVLDFLETLQGTPYDGGIRFEFDIGPLSHDVTSARAATKLAAEAQQSAAAQARALVRALRREGLSVTDAAAVLGVSRGRISQLLSG